MKVELIYRQLGISIAGWREHRKMKQYRLAALLGWTPKHICNMEHGKTRIQLHHLPRIAKALRCRVSDLIPIEWFDAPP